MELLQDNILTSVQKSWSLTGVLQQIFLIAKILAFFPHQPLAGLMQHLRWRSAND